MKYLYILCLYLIGCNISPEEQKLQEKKDDLTNYYQNELSTDLPKDGLIIILQNQNCSACRQDVFQDFVYKFLKENQMSKTFILAKKDTALIHLISLTPKSKIAFSNGYILKEYGLNYALYLKKINWKNILKYLITNWKN